MRAKHRTFLTDPRRGVLLAAAVAGVLAVATVDARAERPAIESVFPATGDAGGGTRVTITGTGFLGTMGVSFGGVAADDVVVWTPLQLSCTVPPHGAGAASVVVTTPAGSNGANELFTYTSQEPPPTVTSVGPSSGGSRGGLPVTLTGTGFTGAGAVTFGGVEATELVVVSDTELRCKTPAHAAGAASVVVRTPFGTNGANELFTFVAGSTPPTVTEVGPESGPARGGTLVTLEGTGFLGATAVTFGGQAATNLVVLSETQLRCLTPPHRQGAVSVVVTTPDGSNAANTLFHYVGEGWMVLRDTRSIDEPAASAKGARRPYEIQVISTDSGYQRPSMQRSSS